MILNSLIKIKIPCKYNNTNYNKSNNIKNNMKLISWAALWSPAQAIIGVGVWDERCVGGRFYSRCRLMREKKLDRPVEDRYSTSYLNMKVAELTKSR